MKVPTIRVTYNGDTDEGKACLAQCQENPGVIVINKSDFNPLMHKKAGEARMALNLDIPADEAPADDEDDDDGNDE